MQQIVSRALPIATIVLIAATGIRADPLPSAEVDPLPLQLAALPPAKDEPRNLVSLPAIVVRPMPNAASIWGSSPRAGHPQAVVAPHFRVWTGYDVAVALHPYTSGMGPCPEGSCGSGCLPEKGEVIRPSHYERSPFSD